MYFRGESLHSPRQAAENNLDTFHVHFCSQIRTGINKEIVLINKRLVSRVKSMFAKETWLIFNKIKGFLYVWLRIAYKQYNV